LLPYVVCQQHNVNDGFTWLFNVIITGTENKKIHTLKLVLEQSDDEEPVLTLMLQGKD
jgi:hypothetical protein